MSFKKNLIIYALLVVMLLCCVSAVSADDSSNMTLASDAVASGSDDVLSDDVMDEVVASESDDMLDDDEENTIYVDSKYTGENQTGTNEYPYKTISAAINGATGSQSTIYIKNGTYSEKSIDIPNGKGFSFIGESADGVIIKKDGITPKVFINANLNNVDLSFTNLTFVGRAAVTAFNVGGTGNLYVINCIFSECTSITGKKTAKNPAFIISTTTSTFKNTLIKNVYFASRYLSHYISYQQGTHIIDNVTIDSVSTAIGATTGETSGGLINIGSGVCVEANNLKITNINYVLSSLIENSGQFNIKNSIFSNNVLKTGREVATVYGLINAKDGNISIESSLISDNKGFDYLVYGASSNSIINLESCTILDNNYNKDLLNSFGNTSLNHNWWGTNDKPNEYVDNWVFKDCYVVKNTDDFEVYVDLTKYTDGNNTYKLEKPVHTFLAEFKLLNFTTNAYSEEGIAAAKISNDNGAFYVDVTYITTDSIPLSVIYVDSNFEGNELGTKDNPYKSISKAVEQSNGWDMIHIKNGNYMENNQITLINSINFLGESQDGVIITGSNKGIFNNPFYMNRNIVLLFNNLTFKDVECISNNAVLSIGKSVSELNISNCVFDNCSGQWGSMSISNSNLNMDNCKILNSKSTDDVSGAIYFNGEGNYEIKNTIINNTGFIGESMIGVIVSNQNNALITLDNVQIINTVSSRSLVSGGKLNVKNSKILNNKINNIFNINSNFTLETSILSNNEIVNEIIHNDGADSIIVNYNAILDDEKLSNNITSCNSDYNWWGTNDKPNEFVNNWVIFEHDVSRSAGKVYVNIYFNNYSNGTDITKLIGSIADGIEANICTSTLDFNSIVCSENGVISTSFTPGDNKYINITFDNVEITEYLVFKTVYVDANSTENGTGTKDNPYNSIQKAIDNTEDGDTIIIKNGHYSENIKWIGGKGVNIHGESKDNVLIVLGSSSNLDLNIGKLSLINLTFENIPLKIQVNDGDLNIINCTFSGIKIYSNSMLSISNSNSNIENCNFLSLNGQSYVPGLSMFATYSGTGNHIIKNSIINNANTVNPSISQINQHKAIKSILYMNSESASLDIDNLTMTNINVIADSIITIDSGSINIYNSSFTNNKINEFGPGVKIGGKSLFYNNDQLNIESSIISSNSVQYYVLYTEDVNAVSNINYNIIQSNSYKTGFATEGSNNLDYNWWGSNTPTYTDANTWIIIDASYAPKDIVAGDNVTVTATLNHYITKDGEIGELTKSVLGNAEVTFTLADGTVINKTTENGVAEITYTINQSENVNISAYGEQVTVPIAIKTLRINIDEVSIDGNTNITVLAPGVNANVTLIIDGVSETVEVKDSYTKTLENLKAGNHSVVVIYNDGTNLEFDSKPFTVEKLPTEINIENITVDAGVNVPLEFTIAEDATGSVFVEINGVKSFNKLVGGTFHMDLENLAIGNNTISVSYEGDAKYLGTTKTIQITVTGLNAGLKASTSDIKVGEDAVIDIEINKEVSGDVRVLLGNEVIPVTLIDGKATVKIPNLPADAYTAIVQFVGDNKYLACEFEVSFKVDKIDLPEEINITTDIPEGTTAPEFSINLPEDATGSFTVYVDGVPYTQELVNGSATVKVPEQAPGDHTISTEYSGDAKYPGFSSGDSIMNVPKASIPGGENALNMTTPSNSATPTYSISLPKDAKGNLTVTVDGKDTYTKALENGSATVSVPELASGKHDITVTYTGDDKYASISKTTVVNVPAKSTPAKPVVKKQATKITAKKKTFKASKKVKKYTIILKAGKKPVKKVTVTIKVGKKTYKAKTNAKGKATFKLKKLTKKGKYKAVIKFKGNKNYKASSKKVRITIKK